MKNLLFNFLTNLSYSISFLKLLNITLSKYFYFFSVLFLNIYVFFVYAKFFKKKGNNTKFLGLPNFSPDYRNELKLDLDENIEIYSDVSFRGRGVISIGSFSSINSGVIFGCTGEITLGKYVLVADNVSFRNADHRFDDLSLPMMYQGEKSKKIIIEDDVWIGANAVIVKGVTISKGAIIGANAVVNKDVPPYKIYGGVPAIEIGDRNKNKL